MEQWYFTHRTCWLLSRALSADGVDGRGGRALGRDGRSRQMAFIGFKSVEQATEAIKYFNRTYMDTSKLAVEVSLPPHPSPAAVLC